MGAYLAMVALQARTKNGGKGQIVDFGIYEPLFTLLGPQVVDYDQLGVVQERNGSRLPFIAPRNHLPYQRQQMGIYLRQCPINL